MHWVLSIVCDRSQTWGEYITNVIDYDYDHLPHARLRLRINKIVMYSITITITFESNHDYTRDYIYLETFSEKNKTHLRGLG